MHRVGLDHRCLSKSERSHQSPSSQDWFLQEDTLTPYRAIAGCKSGPNIAPYKGQRTMVMLPSNQNAGVNLPGLGRHTCQQSNLAIWESLVSNLAQPSGPSCPAGKGDPPYKTGTDPLARLECDGTLSLLLTTALAFSYLNCWVGSDLSLFSLPSPLSRSFTQAQSGSSHSLPIRRRFAPLTQLTPRCSLTSNITSDINVRRSKCVLCLSSPSRPRLFLLSSLKLPWPTLPS